jgi:hypothetical protein
MTARPKSFDGSLLCKRQLYEIMLITITHAFTVMPAKAGISLKESA